MIKGTRFFSRRLLPLLLAAVMLLGMLPALTLPFFRHLAQTLPRAG